MGPLLISYTEYVVHDPGSHLSLTLYKKLPLPLNVPERICRYFFLFTTDYHKANGTIDCY